MTWTVHISPFSCANGTTIGLKIVKICPHPAHFSRRFLKSDRLPALLTVSPASGPASAAVVRSPVCLLKHAQPEKDQ
jgi:hypothetical protein